MPRTISRLRELGGGPPHQVALAEPEPGPVRDEVAQGDLARHPGVVHLELGQVLRDGIVPVQPAVLGEDRQGGAGERLGVGGDPEQRVGVDRRGLAQPAHAIALRVHDLAVLHHRDRHSRHREHLHGPRHLRVEPRERPGLVLRERRRGDDSSVASRTARRESNRMGLVLRFGSESSPLRCPSSQEPGNSRARAAVGSREARAAERPAEVTMRKRVLVVMLVVSLLAAVGVTLWRAAGRLACKSQRPQLATTAPSLRRPPVLHPCATQTAAPAPPAGRVQAAGHRSPRGRISRSRRRCGSAAPSRADSSPPSREAGSGGVRVESWVGSSAGSPRPVA